MSPHPIDGKTVLYGLLGHPVGGSLSPAMHNAAFANLAMNAVYVPFPVAPEGLSHAVRGLVAAGVRGFNLTVPHKLAIIPLLDEVTPEARALGAVNAVRCEAGRLVGHNTDGQGFLDAVAEELGWRPAGKRVVLLGAGGAGRAIALALLREGVGTLAIANRTEERAEALAADCRAAFPKGSVEALPLAGAAGRSTDLLVNATTLGMADDASAVALDTLEVADGVVDIVYVPAETPLLAQAKAAGLPHANGAGMLLHQGRLAFQFWTGVQPPLEVMRAALMAGLAARG